MEPSRRNLVLMAGSCIVVFAMFNVSCWRSSSKGAAQVTKLAVDTPTEKALLSNGKWQPPSHRITNANAAAVDTTQQQQPAGADSLQPAAPLPPGTQLQQLIAQLLKDSSSHSQLRETGFSLLKSLYAAGGLAAGPDPTIPLQTMEKFWATIMAKKVVRGPRCLEWSQVFYIPRYLSSICSDAYELAHVGVYCQSRGSPTGAPGLFTTKEGGKGLCADIHNATAAAAGVTFDTIICTQVFEHVERPWVAAKELYNLLAPEGLLVFTVPFSYALHTAPGISDYFRYTVHGAKSILEHAGFCVFFVEASNAHVHTAVTMLGEQRRIPEADLASKANFIWPINILVLATKSSNCEEWRTKYGPLKLPSLDMSDAYRRH